MGQPDSLSLWVTCSFEGTWEGFFVPQQFDSFTRLNLVWSVLSVFQALHMLFNSSLFSGELPSVGSNYFFLFYLWVRYCRDTSFPYVLVLLFFAWSFFPS